MVKTHSILEKTGGGQPLSKAIAANPLFMYAKNAVKPAATIVTVTFAMKRVIIKNSIQNGGYMKKAFTLSEGATYVAIFNNYRKPAFTLAEVLITLGIIGIVAAMTMPALIAKYEKKVAATRVKQAYSIISQAIKLSEAQNGEAVYWDQEFPNVGPENTKLYMEKLILPYMKAKFCGEGLNIVDKCGATVSWAGQTYWLANGVAAAFAPSTSVTGGGHHLYVTIDINGPKPPNKLGNDRFFFRWMPKKGFVPNGIDSDCTREQILSGCNYDGHLIACKSSKTDDEDEFYRHGCTLLLMMDGWEFKEDYPW